MIFGRYAGPSASRSGAWRRIASRIVAGFGFFRRESVRAGPSEKDLLIRRSWVRDPPGSLDVSDSSIEYYDAHRTRRQRPLGSDSRDFSWDSDAIGRFFARPFVALSCARMWA